MLSLLGPFGVPNESRYLVDCSFGGRAPASSTTCGANIATSTRKTMNTSATIATLSLFSRRQNSWSGERASISAVADMPPPGAGPRAPASPPSNERSGTPVVTYYLLSTRLPAGPFPSAYFVSAVKLTSQAALDLFTTALTSVDFTSGGLSQYHGIAAAVPVTCLSIAAHAFPRAPGSVSTSALAIALLMAGSFSCGQFELLLWTMFFPLKVGSSIDCGSAKSFSQPTLGQTSGSVFGTPQNFEYIVSRVTGRKLTLNPSCWKAFSTRSAAPFWFVLLTASIVICGPLYLPFLKPAFFM